MRLILLPGLDGTGLLFNPLLSVLPNDIDIDVISYPSDEILSYGALEGYIECNLPKDEKFILVAESFSGVLAYNIAIKSPKNLSSVIFVASFLKPPTQYLKLFKWLPLSILFKLYMPTIVLKTFLLGNDISNTLINLFKESLNKVSGEVLASRFNSIATLNLKLEKINTPCLYIQADEDKLVPEVNLDAFRSIKPDIKVMNIKGPHFILQANPTDCAKVILKEYQLKAHD